MLTVARNSLSEEVMNEVRLFVDQHNAWPAAAWDLGRSDLTVKSDLSGDAGGPVLFSALEGMMAFALVRPNPEAVFRAQAETLLAALGVQAYPSTTAVAPVRSADTWVLKYSRALPSPPCGSADRNIQTGTAATGGQVAPCAGARVGKHRILALRAICLRRVAPRAGAPIEID